MPSGSTPVLRRRLFVTIVTVPALCTLPWQCLEEERVQFLTKVTYNSVHVCKYGEEGPEKEGDIMCCYLSSGL